MAYEYRLEEVDEGKSKTYGDAKKAQQQKQADWAKKQKNAAEKQQPQTEVTIPRQ